VSRLLALETATEACSAALWIDGVVDERYEIAPREHARLIVPMIDDLLAAAGLRPGDLDAIAFGRGPGSFTGLRIAAATAQGIAFAIDRPVVPVSSLAALAQQAIELGHERVLAAFDARMNEVYCGVFVAGEEGLAHAAGAERVVAPNTVPRPDGDGWFGIGSGWVSYRDTLEERLDGCVSGCDGECYPRAVHVVSLAAAAFATGTALPAEQALPVYLRNEVAKRAG